MIGMNEYDGYGDCDDHHDIADQEYDIEYPE